MGEVMQNGFAFICLMDRKQLLDSKEMLGSRFSKLQKRISVKWYYKKLIKKLPIKIDTMPFLGDNVSCVMLPFIEEELSSLSEDYLEKYINHVMSKHELKQVYCINELYQRDPIQQERERSLLKFLYIEELIERALYMKRLEMKNMKLTLIDSGDKRIEYILELLSMKLNYLTIITSREEYFESFRDMIYDTTGLVVEIINTPLREPIEGNIVIDLDENSYKDYNYFAFGACVIDVNSSSRKRQYLHDRRKDLTILYDLRIYYNGRLIQNDMMANYMRAKSININLFFLNYDRSINHGEIIFLLKKYPIDIEYVTL